MGSWYRREEKTNSRGGWELTFIEVVICLRGLKYPFFYEQLKFL